MVKINTVSALHNKFKREHNLFWRKERDELIKQILNSKTPDWGSIALKVTQNGI